MKSGYIVIYNGEDGSIQLGNIVHKSIQSAKIEIKIKNPVLQNFNKQTDGVWTSYNNKVIIFKIKVE